MRAVRGPAFLFAVATLAVSTAARPDRFSVSGKVGVVAPGSPAHDSAQPRVGARGVPRARLIPRAVASTEGAAAVIS